jgi:hypothetical protein
MWGFLLFSKPAFEEKIVFLNGILSNCNEKFSSNKHFVLCDKLLCPIQYPTNKPNGRIQ